MPAPETPQSEMRPLLFVGDIHLGRSPQRLIAGLEASGRGATGLESDALGPAEAWRRVVRAAKSHDVQAVVLAGDVVDQDKDRFEAWGQLRRGVASLVAAGIRVLGVAGNHDAIALPRLAERISAFELLGAGGCWQRAELHGVDLIGWSFPSRHHSGDPLAEPGLGEAVAGLRLGTVHLGVLHTELDARRSVYAPTQRRALDDLSLQAWFLGHIHQPDDLDVARPIGYLGSLVGLDRGESGPRGPWLITPKRDGTISVRQLPLGPVLWRDLQVDISGLNLAGANDSAAQDALHSALERAVMGASRDDPWLAAGDFSAVGCSVTFTGLSDAPKALRRFKTQRGPADLGFEVDGCPWVVVHMEDATRPRWDLVTLSAERSPVGRLAKLLLQLDAEGASAVPAAVREAQASLETELWDVAGALPLASATLEASDGTATRVEAVRLLEQLLDQRRGQAQNQGGG